MTNIDKTNVNSVNGTNGHHVSGMKAEPPDSVNLMTQTMYELGQPPPAPPFEMDFTAQPKHGSMFGLQPPHNEGAEIELLNKLIADPHGMAQVDFLVKEDFFLSKNGHLYDILKALYQRDKTYDYVTIVAEIKARKLLDYFGGDESLASMDIMGRFSQTFITLGIRQKAEIILRDSVYRQIADICKDGFTKAFSGPGIGEGMGEGMGEGLIADLIKRLSDIQAQRHVSQGVMDITALTDMVSTKIEQAYHAGVQVTGVQCGLTDLDNVIDGFRPGTVNLFAGRPSMGKSSLGLTIAKNVAMQGKNVVFFSLEMTGESLIQRLISSECNIPYKNLRRGQIPEDHWGTYYQAVATVASLPLHIIDDGGLTVTQMVNHTMRLDNRLPDGVDLVIIDHMGRAKSELNRGSQYEKVTHVGNMLGNMPKQIGGIPVVAFLQLNRAVESTASNIPALSHLRDSGVYEEIADVVGLIYREDYYNPNCDMPGLVNIFVAKNRDGETRPVNLFVRLPVCQFQNLTTIPLND